MGVPRQKDMADAQGSPVERIEAFLDKIEALQTLQDKTGIKKLYLAAGVALVVTIIIFFGFVYPAYASFKSLEANDVNDDRLWLTYWVVYSCFCLIEGFLEYVLFWVPFYYPIKLAFLCYLFLPQTKGAVQLYEKFLRPALKPYVTLIDGAANDAINKVQGAASTLSGQASAAVGKETVKTD